MVGGTLVCTHSSILQW